MKINNRWKIILLATIFNLSFEYSMRGFYGFFKPVLPFFLFGFYFTLYSMLEDLIIRFKIKNYQLVLAAFLYGIFPMAFATGALFNKPRFLGIDWVALFYIGFLWWGILQAVFTFYFANRIVRRNWDHPQMGRLGWFLCIGYNIAALSFMKIVSPYQAPVQPIAYLIFIFIAVTAALFLWQDLQKNKNRQPWQFEPSGIMDVLSFGSLILFLFLGTYFASGQVVDPVAGTHINPVATKIVHLWTIISVATFLIYRFLIRKKEITI